MLVERLRLENHVKIIDYIDERDVPKYYAACDVYAMPSRMEGWGIGIMEAMSAGKPVVATRAGGIPELVSSGKNGILVEPGNVSALASAISKLLASQALRNRLGAAGRKTVRRYSWEETARKTINVYEEAIASREKASRVGRGRGG
jgi:glycosyltransferase involved in cell wall biosynthesis